jgi:glutaminyl-tRNA synthetase
MVVIEPLKLTIENFDEFKHIKTVEVDDFPAVPNSAKHTVAFDREVYIEADDYRESAGKDFRRLTNQQTIGLKNIGIVIRYVGTDQVDFLF